MGFRLRAVIEFGITGLGVRLKILKLGGLPCYHECRRALDKFRV